MHIPSSASAEIALAPSSPGGASWQARYGDTHRLRRVTDFPAGIAEPTKVRLYARRDHFILQFWDPAAKRTLSVRVAGDLIDALAEARKIEARLLLYKTAGRGVSKLEHGELVDRFLADLHRRADAGELAVATVDRYGSALGKYRDFCERPEVRQAYPTANRVNRDFRLAFAAHLASRSLRRNDGSSSSAGQGCPVFDTVRAMFNWAADPNRGNLLPQGFCSPFDRTERPQRQAARDPFGEPDITVTMAVEFIGACDAFQLPLFATLILYGLRAAEPLYLFREHLDDSWLKVNCLPELEYLTKGQRDKRFPLVRPLGDLLHGATNGRQGLLFVRRATVQKSRETPLFGEPLTRIVDEFRRRCRDAAPSAVGRQRIREELIREAGGLNYDHIEHEFRSIAARLSWPKVATLKDFRHMFSTCLENAGVPEFYRRYFMGQSPGKTPIVTYTHLNELQIQFAKAVQNSLAPLVTAVAGRALLFNPFIISNTEDQNNEQV